MGKRFEKKRSEYPVSPLVDIENLPEHLRWQPGVQGGSGQRGKFIEYIESKKPGLQPAGWRDITPYFGHVWPKCISGWRTMAAKQGYYISVQLIVKGDLTYRAILVCLNPF